MTRPLNGQEQANIRQAARLAAEEREKVRRRSEDSARSREQWNNTSFGGKVTTILVAVGALVLFGTFQEKSPSSGANEAPSSVSALAVAPANDIPSSGTDANMAAYSAASSVVPPYADIAGGRAQPQGLPNIPSPAEGISAPGQNVNRELSFVQRTAPLYPPQALRQRHEGTTVLQVAVNKRGKVENVSIETSSGYRELDRAAEAAARNWTFNPAIRDGQPTASVLRTPVKFSLNIM